MPSRHSFSTKCQVPDVENRNLVLPAQRAPGQCDMFCFQESMLNVHSICKLPRENINSPVIILCDLQQIAWKAFTSEKNEFPTFKLNKANPNSKEGGNRGSLSGFLQKKYAFSGFPQIFFQLSGTPKWHFPVSGHILCIFSGFPGLF